MSRTPAVSVALALLLGAACGKEEKKEEEESSASETPSGTVGNTGNSGGAGTNAGGVTDDYANVRAILPYADKKPANGRKVLIVVANDGFYFKEYSDPRVELEAAGFTVVVAAASTPSALPHGSSGQLQGDGRTTVDLRLADVNAAEYDALVFAGGWGASNYYFAYDGKIDYEPWAQKTEHATRANELINAFAAADKYVVGICNGVQVLAWSRVGGKSLLDGKNVAAPDGGAPGQTYKGVAYGNDKLVMSTMATDNGAKVAPPYSIGDARTAKDDVVVDGKVITAQNQYSAQEAGRKLAELLTITP